MINTAATRYMNDVQLTHVAKNSPQQQSDVSLHPSNLTRYGLPENNMSVATQEFLKNNRHT